MLALLPSSYSGVAKSAICLTCIFPLPTTTFADPIKECQRLECCESRHRYPYRSQRLMACADQGSIAIKGALNISDIPQPIETIAITQLAQF